MDHPIRVLQILGIVAGGGVESVIMNYYQHIDRSKVQFDFIVHNDNRIDITQQVEAMGGKVYKVTPYYKNPVIFMHEIYEIIKKNHYKIVHSNMNTISAFPLFAAWFAGVPVRILHNHSTSSPGETKRNIMKAILRPFAKLFANHYFACSQLAADWMYGKKLAHSDKVQIINNAIDLQKFAFSVTKRKQLRQKLGIEGEFVIGHVGRFMFQKNHGFLIDIFAEIHARHADTILLLIGDGPLRPVIEQKVRNLHLQDSVKFLGLRNDVQDLYNAMDLFLLPSYYEGLPVVGVEVQANGLLIIVSDKVTRELDLTDVIKYEPIDKGTDLWINMINDFYKNKSDIHENTLPMMQQSGFDICDAVKKLVNQYMKLKQDYAD